MSGNTTFMTPVELKVHQQMLADGYDPRDDDSNDTVLDAETRKEIADDNVRLTTPPETDEERTAREATEKAAADALAEAQATPVAPAPPVEALVAATPAPAVEVAIGKDGLPVDLSDLTGLRLAPLPTVDEATYLKTTSTLEDQISAIDAQWEDGTITPEQRREQLKPLKAQLNQANVAHASVIGEYNATARMNHQQTMAVIDRIKAAGLRDGLDYTNEAKAAQYDAATAAIARDPANASLSWVQVSQKADLAVRAMNGITVKAPAPPAAPTPPATPAAPATAKAPTAPPKREEPPAPPTTLRDLPVAARAAEQGQTLGARIAAGDANQKDAIWRNMTPAQRRAALDE